MSLAQSKPFPTWPLTAQGEAPLGPAATGDQLAGGFQGIFTLSHF